MTRTLMAATAMLVLAGTAQAGPCTDRLSQIEKSISTSDAGAGPTKSAAPGNSGGVSATPSQVPKAGETPQELRPP